MAGHFIGILLQEVAFFSIRRHLLRLFSYNIWSSTEPTKVEAPDRILCFYFPTFIYFCRSRKDLKKKRFHILKSWVPYKVHEVLPKLPKEFVPFHV